MRPLLGMCVWCLLLAMALPCRAATPILVRADMWMPYNGHPEAPRPGYMVEVIREIFEPQGYAIDYGLISWSRALEECRHGHIHAVIGAGEDRQTDFIFPEEEIGWSGYAWFVRTGFNWTFTGLESLRSVRLGVCDTCTYDDALDAYIADYRHTQAVQPLAGEDMVQKNVAKLLGKRIDVFYEDPLVVGWELLRHNATHLVKLATMAPEERFERIFMGFSKARPESRHLAQLFDEGIRQLRASGRLAEILSQYNLEDWKAQLPPDRRMPPAQE
ncbi:MAG: transporter substrate-binding domain-containing protein [Desulfovibrio sp.]|nr:transporter substrate-binding domain-containing protein [Desulfovibrio sp.]